MRFVHAREGEEAQMVMVEARKGGGKELTVLSPLYIWKDRGIYTDEVELMLGLPRPNSY
jgi:tRNA1Val (adenine37-N6)-methyltransferase